MKNGSRSRVIVIAGMAALALVVVSTAAQAQGVLFVKNSRVSIGTDTPEVPLHIDVTGDPVWGNNDFAGMGPTPHLPGGEGFNFGYAPTILGGFFNTRAGANNNLSLWTNTVARIWISGTTGKIVFGTNVFNSTSAHALLHKDSGAHLTAGGVWTNASSRELKQDITELSAGDAMDALRGLSPVTYRYKAEPDEQYVGFVAEDVPDLVATGDRKSLSPMDVTALLTKVVQEQQSTIEELSRRLAELERR